MARRKSYGKKKRGTKRRMRKRSRRSGSSLAKKAFNLAKRLAHSTEETKYFRRGSTGDLTSTTPATFTLTDISQYSQIFADVNGFANFRKLTGNKAYSKRIQGRWEVHMDNVNNEEETTNFTVAVVSVRGDADATVAASGVNTLFSRHTDSTNGQVYFDPRIFKIHYYKYFTRTQGGTSPGTAGESTRYGSFRIPWSKMMRFQGGGDPPNYTTPASLQDNLYFVIFTDNSAVDLENPRYNCNFMWVIKDNDSYNA